MSGNISGEIEEETLHNVRQITYIHKWLPKRDCFIKKLNVSPLSVKDVLELPYLLEIAPHLGAKLLTGAVLE